MGGELDILAIDVRDARDVKSPCPLRVPSASSDPTSVMSRCARAVSPESSSFTFP